MWYTQAGLELDHTTSVQAKCKEALQSRCFCLYSSRKSGALQLQILFKIL